MRPTSTPSTDEGTAFARFFGSGRGPVSVRVLAALVIIGTVLFATPSVASAHAVVLSSNPADNQVIPVAPKDLQIQFSEAVSLNLGGLTVLNSEGQRVDKGDHVKGVTADTIRVGLQDGLADGTYVANYRVISADGHPVSGAIIFGVGASTTVDRAGTQGLRSATDPGTEVIGAIFRFLTYAGALLAAGLAFFLAFLHDHRPDGHRLDTIVRVASFVAAVAALGTVATQAALATGRGFGAAGDLDVLHKVLAESLGWSTGVLFVGLAVVYLSTAVRSLILVQTLALYGGLTVAISFVLWGHASESEQKWLALISDGAHTATAAVWFGGLVGLGLTLRWRNRQRHEAPELLSVATNAARSSADPSLDPDSPDAAADHDEDERQPTLVEDTAEIVDRFSYVAALTLAVLVIAGGALVWTQVGTIGSLLSTTYGRVLLAKVGVVLVIVCVAAFNRHRLVPEILDHDFAEPTGPDQVVDGPVSENDVDEDPRWHRLFRSVRIEALGILVVLALTSVLVNIAPSRTASNPAGVFNKTVPVDQGGQVNLVVAPDRVGKNVLHVSYLDDQGHPADVVSQLSIEFTLPDKGVGPISREALRAGPGHYLLEGDELSIAGDWQVTLVGRVSEFDQVRSTFTLPVAP